MDQPVPPRSRKKEVEQLEAASSSQGRRSQKLPEGTRRAAARGCQKLSGGARSGQEKPPELPGACRSCQEQAGAFGSV